jgi:hypothetical protein
MPVWTQALGDLLVTTPTKAEKRLRFVDACDDTGTGVVVNVIKLRKNGNQILISNTEF